MIDLARFPMRRAGSSILLSALFCIWWCFTDTSAATHRTIEFNREIRPILADNCFACHGPDKNKRKAGLRLDLAEAATSTLESGDRAIVPGDVEHSKLLQLVTATDEDD